MSFHSESAPSGLPKFVRDSTEALRTGKSWHTELHKSNPVMVPHELPDLAALDELIHDLPLAVRSFADEPEFYNVMMAVPPGYSFGGAPIRLKVCLLFLLVLSFVELKASRQRR